jgi:hypothetical protein
MERVEPWLGVLRDEDAIDVRTHDRDRQAAKRLYGRKGGGAIEE